MTKSGSWIRNSSRLGIQGTVNIFSWSDPLHNCHLISHSVFQHFYYWSTTRESNVSAFWGQVHFQVIILPLGPGVLPNHLFTFSKDHFIPPPLLHLLLWCFLRPWVQYIRIPILILLQRNINSRCGARPTEMEDHLFTFLSQMSHWSQSSFRAGWHVILDITPVTLQIHFSSLASISF